MQPESGSYGRLLREARPGPPLYWTYAGIGGIGAAGLLWVIFSTSPWNFLLRIGRLHLVAGSAAIGLMLWGLLGIRTLSRWRLRLFEGGVYHGPGNGRGGVYLGYDAIRVLMLDVVHFPEPMRPLIGHYRIGGDEDEIVLYPKLYADLPSITAEIAKRSGLAWTEVEVARSPHRHVADTPGTVDVSDIESGKPN